MGEGRLENPEGGGIMTVTHEPATVDRETLLHDVRVLKMRLETDTLALHRKLLRLQFAGAKQSEMARAMLITQPSVSSMLKTAKGTPEAVEGFSAATPFEACELYVAGGLSRDQLIEELATWPYPRQDELDADDFNAPQPGTFEDVELAAMRGLIDSDLYEAVFERLTANQA